MPLWILFCFLLCIGICKENVTFLCEHSLIPILDDDFLDSQQGPISWNPLRKREIAANYSRKFRANGKRISRVSK